MIFQSAALKTPSNVKFNNISELRLLFALCVVVSHSIQLGEFTRYDVLRQIFSSEVAVQGFFMLSGFLVLGSYSRTLDINKFYRRRLLRIFPGYLVAVLLFLVLALIQAHALHIDVNHSEIYRYLLVNMLLLNFLQPGIEGVFKAGLYQEINGALWTIKLEVMFYALVPVLYRAGRRWSFRATAFALIVTGLSWRPLLEVMAAGGIVAHPALAHQLPGQLHFFGLGVLMFDVTQRPQHRLVNVIIVLAAVLLFGLAVEKATAMQMFLLSAFIYAVTQLPELRSHLGDTDLSYGIYLSHFPIIQLLIGAGAPSFGVGVFLLLVLALATAYALVSWHWVERPAMELGRGVQA